MMVGLTNLNIDDLSIIQNGRRCQYEKAAVLRRGLVLALIMVITLFLCVSLWNIFFDLPLQLEATTRMVALSVSLDPDETTFRRELYRFSDAKKMQQQEVEAISRPRKLRTIAVYIGNGLDDTGGFENFNFTLEETFMSSQKKILTMIGYFHQIKLYRHVQLFPLQKRWL
jgi:hypothetical protein